MEPDLSGRGGGGGGGFVFHLSDLALQVTLRFVSHKGHVVLWSIHVLLVDTCSDWSRGVGALWTALQSPSGVHNFEKT